MRGATTSCAVLALCLWFSAERAAAQPAGGPPQPTAGPQPTTAPSQSAAGPLALFPLLPVWTTPLDANLASPPVFRDGRAFVALEGGGLAAYDLLTGTRAWHLDVAVSGSLAVSDEHLFFGTTDSLTAVDVKTGADNWHAEVAGYAGGPLVFGEGLLLGVVGPQSVGAFRASDGQLVWRRDFDSGIHAAPALAPHRAYVSLADGRLMALDSSTGEPVWARKLGAAPNEVLAVENRLYVGSDDNYLYCLFAKDGSTNWRWRTGGDVIGTPLSDGERVYFVSKDNVLRGLDRRSGAQRWKRALAGRPTRGVVGLAGVVLASGIAPRVWGFSTKDGTPAGDVTAVGELASQPYVETINALPWLFFASRDISAGARLQAFKRNLEPVLNTPLTAIPGSITLPQSGSAQSSATASAPAAPASGPSPSAPSGASLPPR